MKIGGPIEAARSIDDVRNGLRGFPPMKIGGPIEAAMSILSVVRTVSLSTDENRWPH